MGPEEVSVIGDSLYVNINVIIYVATSIRHYGKISDIVAYLCLIFLVCYSDPAEYFSELCRLNLYCKTHIQKQWNFDACAIFCSPLWTVS
jgi:hypothetical protein